MATILDYSAGYPNGSDIASAGHAGVIRYLRKEGVSRVQPITAAEVEDLRRHGLSITLVYQHVTKDRVTQGRTAGQSDARWAQSQAAAVGLNPRAIYFAVDFDATPSTVAEYFRGVADTLGVDRTGAYGGFRVVSYLFDQGLIRWGWQTAAWSSGRREARAHLYQRIGQVTVDGVSCDVNEVLKEDYGQDPSPQGEVIMAGITEDELKTMRDQIAYMVVGLGGRWHAGGQAIGESERHQAVMAALATVISNQQDDLDADTVLARLDESVRAGTHQAIAETILPALARIEEALAQDDAGEAKAILDELGNRLRSVA